MSNHTQSIRDHRKPIASGFSKFLATTYSLYIKTQNFHWNVTGHNFSTLHLFFEKQYEELAEAIDVIAEHIRALEYTTPASFSEYQKLSKIKDSIDKKNAVTMLRELAADHSLLIEYTRELLELTKKHDDDASQDLLVNRLRAHEKHAWMLQSFLAE